MSPISDNTEALYRQRKWKFHIPLIARCERCDSIWVCWNWMHSFSGDREAYEKANPHIPPSELMNWGHECWDCTAVHETFEKVRSGIPYWFLRWFYPR